LIRTRRNPANVSIARVLPGFDARHATRRARHARVIVFLGILALAVAVLAAYLAGAFTAGAPRRAERSSSSAASPSSSALRGPAGTQGVPSATATLFPTQLGAPISDDSVLAGPGADLTILGGATTGGYQAPGVFTFDTSTGALVHVANLSSSLEDAAATVISGKDLVLGGRSSAVQATVQAVSAPAPAANGSANAGSIGVATARALGTLPKPRTDAAAVTMGPTTYLVGGDDGATPDASVIATTDGTTFETVATLKRPVRFPAVAAVGTTIYVLGGEVLTASGSWAPVDTVQAVYPARREARIVGRLPAPLSEASAVTLSDAVFRLGGIGPTATSAQVATTTTSTTAAPNPGTPGSAAAQGTTQGSVLWFDPERMSFKPLAQLPVPVCRSGVAVVGSTAWVVGGLSNSTPVASVQEVSLDVPPPARPKSSK
jgi:hypothetical protein